MLDEMKHIEDFNCIFICFNRCNYEINTIFSIIWNYSSDQLYYFYSCHLFATTQHPLFYIWSLVYNLRFVHADWTDYVYFDL